jgi:hypothetical protein
MAGSRHEFTQAVRGRDGTARITRGLHRVNVEVIRTRVARVQSERAFQGAHDLVRSRLGPSIERPEVPRAEIHHGLRVQGRNVRVLRVRLRHITHGRGIRFVELAAVIGLR